MISGKNRVLKLNKSPGKMLIGTTVAIFIATVKTGNYWDNLRKE